MTPPRLTLAERLARRIRLTGPMTVADYMREALADPELGYYRRGDPLGVAGDFTTAPEISQMFGEMIGLWCVDVWSRMGAPSPVRLVELGPGRGTLMADALRAARLRPEFGAAADLHLVEISESLRARQAETLQGAPAGIAPTWHDEFGTVPDGPLLLIANEFFDALPVHQFERTADGWHERVVTIDPESDSDSAPDGVPDGVPGSAGPFRFALAPPGPAFALLEPERQAAPPGSVAEVSPAGIALAETIGRRLATFGGAALIIDYGYGAGVTGDSLQALRRHRRHDPLVEPGCADITAHVDFAALARAARTAGAVARGPVPQGIFLDRLGLRLRAATLLDRATPEQARDIHAAVERLLEPTQMGTLFKALAITSAGLPIPAGFESVAMESPGATPSRR